MRGAFFCVQELAISHGLAERKVALHKEQETFALVSLLAANNFNVDDECEQEQWQTVAFS